MEELTRLRNQLAMRRCLIEEQARQTAADRAEVLSTMKEVLRLQLDYLRRRPAEQSAAAARELMPALRLVGKKLGIDVDELLKEATKRRK